MDLFVLAPQNKSVLFSQGRWGEKKKKIVGIKHEFQKDLAFVFKRDCSRNPLFTNSSRDKNATTLSFVYCDMALEELMISFFFLTCSAFSYEITFKILDSPKK